MASDGDVGLPGENPGELNSTLVPCLNETLWDEERPRVAFPLQKIKKILFNFCSKLSNIAIWLYSSKNLIENLQRSLLDDVPRTNSSSH